MFYPRFLSHPPSLLRYGTFTTKLHYYLFINLFICSPRFVGVAGPECRGAKYYYYWSSGQVGAELTNQSRWIIAKKATVLRTRFPIWLHLIKAWHVHRIAKRQHNYYINLRCISENTLYEGFWGFQRLLAYNPMWANPNRSGPIIQIMGQESHLFCFKF